MQERRVDHRSIPPLTTMQVLGEGQQSFRNLNAQPDRPEWERISNHVVQLLPLRIQVATGYPSNFLTAPYGRIGDGSVEVALTVTFPGCSRLKERYSLLYCF